MNRIIFLILSLTLIIGCSSSSKTVKQEVKLEIKPEIPIEILNKKGIAAMNPNYKRNYSRLLPYLFYNENNAFNGIQGDFFNIDNQALSNLNIMPGYWRKYGKYENSLIVLIAMSNTSTSSLKEIPVVVESSKHGVFEKVELRNTGVNKSQKRILFVKKIEI